MRKQHITIYILGFLTMLLTASCTTYNNGLVRKERVKLSIETMNSFNMTFSSKSYKYCVKKGMFELKEIDLLSQLNISNYKLSNNTSYKSYKVKFISIDTLLVQGVDFNDSIVANYTFDGKLKNGYFYLNNKQVEFNGIPYLLGGSSSEKRRIGISKDNDLIVQTAVDHTGAFLLIFGAGYSYNVATFFKEIK
ncbi:MAG: hypothetical protein JXR36_16130 [Bacteroidales bacterium]|nr:hypothetical protein [Bacteroidales bacterium]